MLEYVPAAKYASAVRIMTWARGYDRNAGQHENKCGVCAPPAERKNAGL